MDGLNYYTPRKFLNVSTLTATARCPRKAFYSSGCGLDSPGEKPALKFGEAIHRGLPECLVGEPKTRLVRAVEGFDKVWNPLISDDKRNKMNAVNIFSDFIQAHMGNNGLYTLVHPKDLPFVQGSKLDISGDDSVSDYEVIFAVDIGLKVPLVGRIDGIGRLRDTGELCLLEFKTTSSLYNYFDAFTLSPQVLLYNAGANISGIKVSTAIVEALEVSKTKTNTIAQPYLIHPHHVEEAVKWAKFHGQLFLDCEERGDFPKFFSGCHPYSMFGSRGYQCDYMNLCSPPNWTSNVSLYVQKKDNRYEILERTAE